MDILIFIGQSNMQGSTGEKDIDLPVENAYEYKFLTDSLVPLCNPVGEDIGDHVLLSSALGNGSLLPSFCRKYISLTGKKAVAIHTAKGNSSIMEWQKGSKRFDAMMLKIKNGIKKAEETEKVDKIFIIWLQGESDALQFTGTQKYLEMLIQLKNDIKSVIKFDKFTIIRQGFFAEYADWINRPESKKRKSDKAIMKAFDTAPKKDKDFYILTKICTRLSRKKKYLNANEYGPHYNNKGMKIIGEKAGRKLAGYRKNGKLAEEIQI